MKLAIFCVVLACICQSYGGKLKVVNSDEVEPHSLPYIVSISTIINENPVLCGGSLIREDVVLTAARCLNGADKVTVTLGAHNLLENEDTQVKVESTDFIIHERYNETTMSDDIALINLPNAVKLTDAIAVIGLPPNIFEDYNEQLGLVAGWGRINDTTMEYSPVLRKIEVVIIPFLMCDLANLFQLNLNQMCTTGTLGKVICLGDNGGPLVVDGVQVGIASFGNNVACSAGFPSVYTKLTSYLLWIQGHLN